MVSQEKIETVKELTEQIDESRDLVITDYKGLTVEETEELRQELYENGSRYRVVKNRLAQRSIRNVYAGDGAGADSGEPEESSGDEDLELDLEDISGVGPSKVDALEDEGFETVQDIAGASIDSLSEVSGVGEATAEKFKDSAQELVQQSDSSSSGGQNGSTATGEFSEELLAELDEYFQGTTAIAFRGDGYVNVAEV
ncbi:MAG: 50S ribosomal protein L10, partial [bacterium]